MSENRTEAELAEGYEEQRAALADSQEEIKAMREHRLSLLQTGTPEDVLSLDDEIRLEGVKIEIATARMAPLKTYLNRAREERARWVGVDMPSDAELERLLAIVSAAHPSLALEKKQGRFDIAVRNHRDEFKRAFYAIGRMGRLSEPDADRYVSSVFDDANSILRTRLLQEIEGDAFHAAVLAWGDVVWRAADRAMGQVFEIGIARLNQGSPARPMWRDLLAGKANLLAPLPPRGAHASSSTYPLPRVKIRYADGREVDPVAPLWVQ